METVNRICRSGLLFLVLPVELLNPTGGVHKQFLASVKRVRCRTNLDLDQRVFVAVFPFDGILRGHRGFGHELKITGGIMKHDFLVFRVNVFSHCIDIYAKA